jgi:LysR family transcriptional regulator for metE and metH
MASNCKCAASVYISHGGALREHLSQSAISHQIKQLEDRYSAPLFERKSQPLRLTPSGERLYFLAWSLLAQVAQAERDIAQVTQSKAGKLRIAV